MKLDACVHARHAGWTSPYPLSLIIRESYDVNHVASRVSGRLDAAHVAALVLWIDVVECATDRGWPPRTAPRAPLADATGPTRVVAGGHRHYFTLASDILHFAASSSIEQADELRRRPRPRPEHRSDARAVRAARPRRSRGHGNPARCVTRVSPGPHSCRRVRWAEHLSRELHARRRAPPSSRRA